MSQKATLPHLPPETRKRGTALLDQQMWCWGQDIRRPEGNLLLAYGFTRTRPPHTMAGSSMYQWSNPTTRHQIMLWGFGLASLQEGVRGVFLKCFGFTPRLLPTGDPFESWGLDQLPRLRLPRTKEEGQITLMLFAALLDWISTYEQWIQETCGCAYREQCLSAWQKTICSVESVAHEWKRLATECQNSWLRSGKKQ